MKVMGAKSPDRDGILAIEEHVINGKRPDNVSVSVLQMSGGTNLEVFSRGAI
jgi:hypothetical protein